MNAIRSWRGSVLYYVVLTVIAVPFVFPFLWMITSAVKPENELFAIPPSLFPRFFRWANFSDVFDLQPFARQYFNSIYIAVVTSVITMVLASMSGYAFARIRFRMRGALFIVMISAMMMPAEVTIIPLFNFFQDLGLVNNHIPLIVLPVFGAQGIVSMFLMRQFFLGLPEELEESARLDGLSEFGILRRIALPLAGPALAAVAILAFLNSWNLFVEPTVLIQDENLFTIPLALSALTDEYGAPFLNLQIAATAMAVVPTLLVYVFAQRWIVENLASSGMKG